MKISRFPTERFFKLSNSVFRYGLTPIQFVVYSHLVCCAGSRGKCYPSMQNIAANCNCSPNAARAVVHVLQAKRLIKIAAPYRQDGRGRTRQANNSYFIEQLPPIPDCPQVLYLPAPTDGGEMYKQNEYTK